MLVARSVRGVAAVFSCSPGPSHFQLGLLMGCRCQEILENWVWSVWSFGSFVPCAAGAVAVLNRMLLCLPVLLSANKG